jgi:CHAD domain-containing protein
MAKKTDPAWNTSKTPSQNASLRLPKLARAYFEEGRKLFEETRSAPVLHRFRLATKRFRYTLELFRPCYGPGLERRLALLRAVQDYLGEINDCAAATELLGPSQNRIAAFLERRRTAKTSALRQYWQQTFDAAGQERLWVDYLARFTRK